MARTRTTISIGISCDSVPCGRCCLRTFRSQAESPRPMEKSISFLFSLIFRFVFIYFFPPSSLVDRTLESKDIYFPKNLLVCRSIDRVILIMLIAETCSNSCRIHDSLDRHIGNRSLRNKLVIQISSDGSGPRKKCVNKSPNNKLMRRRQIWVGAIWQMATARQGWWAFA